MGAITTLDGWRDRLLASQCTAQRELLMHCQMLVDFRQYCDTTQGGTTFGKSVKDWLGYDKSVVAKMVAIGACEQFRSCETLPGSIDTLYLITRVEDEDDAEQFLRADTTRREVQNFIKPPAEKQPEPTPDEAKVIRAAMKLLGLDPLQDGVLEAARDWAIDNCSATTDAGVESHTTRVEEAFDLLNTKRVFKALTDAVKPDKPVRKVKEKLIPAEVIEDAVPVVKKPAPKKRAKKAAVKDQSAVDEGLALAPAGWRDPPAALRDALGVEATA